MKEATILNNIEKLVSKMNYKTALIEITTDEAVYTINLSKKRQIGFRMEENSYGKTYKNE